MMDANSSILDVCVRSKDTNFYDELGRDIIPIRMVTPIHHVSMGNKHNDDQYMDLFSIEITLLTQKTIVEAKTLIYFSINGNVLPNEMRESLGKPILIRAHLCFMSLLETKMSYLGSCHLKI